MVLSIIIPIYNVEKYVRHTLDSVYAQQFSDDDVEIIIVNDGTPDNSMDIVYEYKHHRSLHIISQENQGLSGARNTGLKHAIGKYVWFVDSDDWLEKGFISKMISFLRNDNIDVYMMPMKIIKENGGDCTISTFANIMKPTEIVGYEAIWQEVYKRIEITPIQKYIIRRDFIIENKLFFYKNIYHEDIEYAPRMLISAEKLVMIPWVGYCYLVRNGGSITTNPKLFKKRCISRMKIYESFERIEQSMAEGPQKKALGVSKYKAAASLFNFMTLESIVEFGEEIGYHNRIIDFKKDTLKHLFYDRNLYHFFKQMLFIISPMLLKKTGKSLV